MHHRRVLRSFDQTQILYWHADFCRNILFGYSKQLFSDVRWNKIDVRH